MNSGCTVVIGNIDNGGVLFTNDQILACSFIENLSNLPNGRVIIKVPSLGLDELINIPSGVGIKVKIASFDSPDTIPDETTINVHGTVVKHYSSSIDPFTSSNSNSFTTYIIEFICAGSAMSHLQLLRGQAILNNSLGAIKKLGKLSNTKILFDDSSIKTQDFMKWLIVNRNLVTAIDLITNRSYVSEDDAIFSAYRLDGSVRIGTIKSSYAKSKDVTYNYATSRFDIVNTPTKFKDGTQLIYGAFDIIHASAIKQSIATTGISRLNLPTSKNKKDANNQGIVPSGTNVDGSINGNTIKVISKKDVYLGNHPNTHDNYDIAPLIRGAVFSNFAHQITILASGESVVEVGDVINVLIPTMSSQASGSGDVLYSKVLSGKYFVHSKQYQFGNDSRFSVILKLMKSDILYDKNRYLEQFGISSGEVK